MTHAIDLGIVEGAPGCWSGDARITVSPDEPDVLMKTPRRHAELVAFDGNHCTNLLIDVEQRAVIRFSMTKLS
ncbi:hypothetical protein [Microbacterium sp.]|uniref:hypothetical protein n=1 Tax=Microbacterium sp. TaxID=51671 RepID=UPI003C72FE6F